MLLVDDLNFGGLDSRMAFEVGANELSIKWPFIFGVGGGVDADVSSASLDVGFKRFFLGWVENGLGCAEEDDDLVLLEVVGGEASAVFGGLDREVVIFPEGLDAFDSGWDRVVSESGGF